MDTELMDTNVCRETPARIAIFDTTLRDGEQSPGSSMTAQQKLRFAHALTELGVDISGGTPESFAAYITSEIPKWTAVVKASGAKME